MSDSGSVRLDKWLWAARLYKTRSLATAAIGAGDVRIARERVKPARDVKAGDRLQIRRGDEVMDVVVREISSTRGPGWTITRRTTPSRSPIALNPGSHDRENRRATLTSSASSSLPRRRRKSTSTPRD
jgi:ribosomal 50S subunit-recycling heat shock protein